MIPVGYLAKRVVPRPEGLNAPQVVDIYSVSSCVNDDFADYINDWKHNGYWLFSSSQDIREVARIHAVDLADCKLFYYEAYEKEFTGKEWRTFFPEPGLPTSVVQPSGHHLEGFDVVTFEAGNRPEDSPLSCNGLAAELETNEHCLFSSLEQALSSLNSGKFEGAEPGPYRIFAVYSVDWPSD